MMNYITGSLTTAWLMTMAYALDFDPAVSIHEALEHLIRF